MTRKKAKRPRRKGNQKISLRLLETAAILAIAFVLSKLMAEPLAFSASALIDSKTAEGYNITDFYNKAADSRPVRTLDNDVVLVDIEDFDRDQLASLIDLVALCEPAVLGVDITFDNPRDDDTAIIEAFRNLTIPTYMAMSVKVDNPEERTFKVDDRTFFMDSVPALKVGIVNLATRQKHGVVRDFVPEFKVTDYKSGQTVTLPSLPKALAEAYRPGVSATIPDSHSSVIRYYSREIPKMNIEDVAENPEMLKGKIVILGALDDEGDKHYTSLGKEIPGVEIHAHAIATILSSEGYIYRLSDTQNWCIALLICGILVFLSLSIDASYVGLTIRILQLVMLYFVVRVGYYFFLEHNIVIDFTGAFLMIAFGLFASDVFIGSRNIFNKIKEKIRYYRIMKKIAKRRSMAMVVMMLIATLGLSAKYTVHSIKGDITAKRAGSEIALDKGVELMPSDEISISPGAILEILNTSNSKVFSSVKSGKYSVARIIIDARMQASNRGSQVDSNIRLRRASKADAYMYVETGKVTRALAEFDPAGETTQVDAGMIANRVTTLLKRKATGRDDNSQSPYEFITDTDETGLPNGFTLTNTLDFPLYFNVIKQSASDNSNISISDLGQPIGCYVLLPGQSISRHQSTPLDNATDHMLVATHYNFDIDKLIDEINRLMTSEDPIPTNMGENVPVYIDEIK